MIKLLKTALLLLLCFTFVSNISSQNSIADAENLIKKGQYQDALLTLNKSISQNPNETKAFMLLADVQMKLGKVELATATYSAVESLGKTDDQFYFAYGLALKMQGKYDQAISKFNKCKSNKEAAAKQIQSCVFAKELIKADDTKKVMNMDFNSEYNDFGATVLNNTIVYNSSKMPFMTDQSKNLFGNRNNNFLNKTLMNGTAAALFIEGDFNKDNVDAFAVNDLNQITFTKVTNDNENIEDRMINSSLFYGEFNGHNVENVRACEFMQEGVSYYSASISADGKSMYFSADIAGGFGGFDIYKSTFDGNLWTAPINLGEDINTSGNEITPFYSESLLYFSSNSHDGLGGYDLYSAQNISDNFINVQNLGVGINSSKNEFYPSIKNLVIYFSSDREGGKGMCDIYRAPLSERHYAVELQEGNSSTDVVMIDNDVNPIVEETPPPAYALNDIAYRTKAIQDIDAMLSGAKKVSFREEVKKDNPKVFFIQLASVSNNGKSDVTKYKPLVRFGNIYKVRVNNTTKVRLGYFLERDETSVLLSKVRSNGFKDAFIVEQELATSDLELLLSQTDANNPAVSSAPVVNSTKKSAPNPSNSTPPVTSGSSNFEYTKPIETNDGREYKVRLGSFEDPIWFDSKKARDLGKIEQWTKGGWTIFILSGFSDYNSADQARIQAINRGFTDAEVVVDNGGIIERLKKN